MSKNKKEIPLWAQAGHAKPVTRREFLAHGLIPFAASTFLPNWMQLLSPESAMAQAACPAGGSNMVPFIQLNLEGGAGLAANYVPMDAGRQLLPSYNIIGLGSNQVPVVRVFNNAPFAGNGVANILTGLQSVATTAAQNNTAFLGICSQSRDDSRENFYSITGLAHKAGLVGSKLPHLGTRDTLSGINQNPVLYSPPSPLVVRTYNDLANSLTYTAGLASLNQGQKEKLTKLIGDLNNSQSRKLASVNSGSQIQDLLNCVGIKNNQLIQEGTAVVDPKSNADLSAVWGIVANTAPNSEAYVLGSMVYNTLIGQAGSASISKGGYDYHGAGRALVTDVRDREAGVIIGKILESAKVLNKPVFLMVTTDGAVSADRSETPDSSFNSDRGSAGMVYLFIYNPAGRPATTDFQIGNYTAGQSADSSVISGPEVASHTTFLNWLKMNNRMDLYSQVVPATRALDAAKIAQVVKVA